MSKVIKVKIVQEKVIYILTSNEGIPFLYVNKYLKFLGTMNRSINTIKSYAYRLKLYWDFIELNQIDFRRVLMNDLVKYIGWLQGKSNITLKQREPKTINYNLMAVFGFYNYLARFYPRIIDTELDFYSESAKKNYSYKSFLEHTKSNVKYKLSALKLRETKKPYKRLNEGQLKKIFQTRLNIRNKLLVSILYETGIRISEALEIKLEDIDISDKKILISKSKTPSGENRLVYISSETVNLLQDYIYEVHEKNNFDNDYLFLKLMGPSRGEVCEYETIMAFFKSLSTKLGFSITPHMFRHMLATELHETGLEISIIKTLLGHKDVQTTMNMYIHPSEKSVREEYNKVAINRERNRK
ncbi:tyrosine-type recombinase/integrase [Bacillus wiedmannii]|uniref:tyrosine-type recombinase/integrase n=1 Tax=Bacillus wiedmannii TaxID=1890302 RepID=UPI002E1B6B9D|nr:tyrosine-type recombinase/integrase [Bacillus wiedmannii]